MKDIIRSNLKEYIENVIFKEYKKNEVGHGINHIKYVIRRSMMFAKEIENINLEMVYVIAAYHDIGHHIDYKNHEKVSADILLNDNRLKEFFNEEDLQDQEGAENGQGTEPDILRDKSAFSSAPETQPDHQYRNQEHR